MEVFKIPGPLLNAEELAGTLHSEVETIRRLLREFENAVEIRSAVRSCYIDEKDGNTVVIDGVPFTSRVLRHNLAQVERVFPFVLTLGPALENVIHGTADMLAKYLMDEMGNMALRDALQSLEHRLRTRFGLGKISYMSPGSLEDWPISEQKGLFSLLPGLESAIGVRLTESLLMLPRKSVSGIYFPTEVDFITCSLCPRPRCRGRKAHFDPEKAKKFGILP